MKIDKRNQQVILLVAILAVIFLAILWFYWRNLLPQPVSETALPVAAPRLNTGGVNNDLLFRREDFRRLTTFGDVPVKVLPSDGNPDLFVSSEQAEGGAGR